ncbi:uncharacterized protein [Taeniopygia guttata]|uniref:uncharacterized protein n=1 Tax=Taeniopygia guttata TaxID=59729 RepID=UPI003BB8C7C0
MRRCLPFPGGSGAAGTGAQRPPLRTSKRSFPLLRSRRAAPAPSPQLGAPEVSASGSQLGRQRQLHSPRDEEPLTVGGGGGRWRGPDSSRDAPPRWPPPPPPSSALFGACPPRAVPRRSPAASVRPSRSPSPAPLPGGEPRGAQAPPAARRTRGKQGIPAQPPALSPGPGAHSPRGEEALPRPGDQLREGHRHRGAEHGEAPSGTAAVAAVTAGPESATAGCRAPTGFAPCPCLETAPESECQAVPFPFLPSFLASRPFPAVSLPPPAPSGARCQAAPCGCRGRGRPPGGPRRSRERPPLPLGGCRESHARRRAAPGWLSGGCSACVSVSCLCLGGRRRGPRRGQPALTPPSDRRRAPNQRRPPPRSARPRSGAPRAATPGQRGGAPPPRQRAWPAAAGAGPAGRAPPGAESSGKEK